MIEKTKEGFRIKDAIAAIRDANKKIAKAQDERDTLIGATITDFEFNSYDEFRQYYFSH